MYEGHLTVCAVVNNVNVRINFQNELNNLLEWLKKWQFINFKKCHNVHLVKKYTIWLLL